MSDNSFVCPYCECLFAISKETYRRDYITTFGAIPSKIPHSSDSTHQLVEHDKIFFDIYFCPNCEKETILAFANSPNFGNIAIPLIPSSLAKKFPNYVPVEIRADYEEAHAIAHLSPKAAATLARRCLQGMIHDFWNIHERNLNAEITELKKYVPHKQWEAIDAVRKVGNIGAHMDAPSDQIITVEETEALLLLELIEHLIVQWYVHRHDEDQMLSNIIHISKEKEHQRKLSKDNGS